MDYYTEIESYIKKNEVNKKARVIEEEIDTLTNYWNIGRLLIEAQGGSERAKYGNGLIKEWGKKLSVKYGKCYGIELLRRCRKYFLLFPNSSTLSSISWSNIVELLPIKDENKRNYYINMCLEKHLTVRELRQEIKSNSYERLLIKPEHIEIIQPKTNYSIMKDIKKPIIIDLDEGEEIKTESDLEIKLLSKLKVFFNQLGHGFTLVDNQYKITYNNKTYSIDILLFNIKLNCYVVVELKVRELKKEDKVQTEFYMKLVDELVKEPFHNKTIGIIITKEQDKYIASFVRSESLIPLTYMLNETK